MSVEVVNEKPTMAEQADIHKLYEESVQNVEYEVEFVKNTFQTIRGYVPYLLREDFAVQRVCLVSGLSKTRNMRLSEWTSTHQCLNGEFRIV